MDVRIDLHRILSSVVMTEIWQTPVNTAFTKESKEMQTRAFEQFPLYPKSRSPVKGLSNFSIIYSEQSDLDKFVLRLSLRSQILKALINIVQV